MTRLAYIDTETYSEVPINTGTYRYAEGVEVMLLAYALDDGPVRVWDRTAGVEMPTDLAAAWADESCLFIAHNAGFDRVVMAADITLPSVPALTRWRCTMAQALAHSLPGGLDPLGVVLGLPQDAQKLKDGKQLVQLFCKPRSATSKIRRATSATHPADWRRFVEYAGQDVTAMREIHRRLPTWNYTGEELALWHLDQEINARGVCVDVNLAHAAIRATTAAKRRLADRTLELTDGEVEAATQRDRLLKHLLNEHGIDLPDMTASTLERRMEDPDLSPALRELLSIRLQASTTSTSKYEKLARSVCADGRLRGLLQFCGAARTGRWSGRLFQPQNLPRPDMKHHEIEDGIAALKLGVEDLLYA